MAATHVSYEAVGWGVGELWLEGDRLLQHELPRAAVAERGSGHELADRFRLWFAGEADDFLDVALDKTHSRTDWAARATEISKTGLVVFY